MKLGIVLTGIMAGSISPLCTAAVIFVPVPAPQLRPDQVCVSSEAKVGDKIANTDGDFLTLTDVHGWLGSRSSPCGGDLNRVAEATYTESPRFHSSFTWTLPVGFRPLDLTVRDRMSCVRLRAVYREGGRELELVVHSWDRTKVIGMDPMIENIRTAQSNNIRGATLSPISPFSAGGLPARRWEVHWKGKLLAPDSGATNTFVEGATELVQIAAAGPDKLLESTNADLTSFVSSIQGIPSEQMASPVIGPAAADKADQ